MRKSYEQPIVAVVGRANVGKSSLFNRLIGTTQAIVSPVAGTTRDRIYSPIMWQGRSFILLDTAGLDFAKDDPFANDLRAQVETGVEEAAVVLFVVDARDGITPTDRQIARWLQRKKQKTIVVVNKIDEPQRQSDLLLPFWDFGFSRVLPTSALSGKQTGDLLDEVVAMLPKRQITHDPEVLHCALIGRPNVGKSSILNALSGTKRVVTSPTPGTTRDMVLENIVTPHGTLQIIDTAGMRRKSKVKAPLEKQAVVQSLRAIDHAEVVFLVLDATQPIAHNELQLARFVYDMHKPVIIVINKMDQLSNAALEAFTEHVEDCLRFLYWSPIIFTSAITGENVPALAETAVMVRANYERRIPQKDLTVQIPQLLKKHLPSKRKGTWYPTIFDVRQTGTMPPTFTLVIDRPESLSQAYTRYLERALRAMADFTGTPLVFRYQATIVKKSRKRKKR